MDKIMIEEILKRLYTIDVYDSDGKEVELAVPLDVVPENHDDEYEYEYYTDDGINEDSIVLTEEIVNIYQNNKDKYDKIELSLNPDRDGYLQYPALVGWREEIDEEYELRLREKETKKVEAQRAKDERKRLREAKKKQTELAQYEELKKKFERE